MVITICGEWKEIISSCIDFCHANTLISFSMNEVVGVKFQTYTVVCLKIISNHTTVYPHRECGALRY
jgi:hypothetical protein